MKPTKHPTLDAYTEMVQAYDHFNAELFGGKLPPCLITFQREKRIYGYLSHKRFWNPDTGSYTHELAMNPAYFPVVPMTEIMQTLVHEQAHLWQFEYGDPGRRKYHNREWADKMISVGLMPSDTGKPGGKQTGEKVADYAIPGGVFQQALEKLLATGFGITWFDKFPARHVHPSILQQAMAGQIEGVDLAVNLGLPPGTELTPDLPELAPSKPTRSKYICECTPKPIILMAKPGIRVRCLECFAEFTET